VIGPASGFDCPPPNINYYLIYMNKISIRRDLFSFLENPDYNRFSDLSDEKEILILL